LFAGRFATFFPLNYQRVLSGNNAVSKTEAKVKGEERCKAFYCRL